MSHLVGELLQLPRAPTHDEANRRKAMRAIVLSSAGLLATSLFELVVVALSGSVALLSDALHNLGDVFTTVGVFVGFRVSKRPATAKYPYGYGRAEDLAGVVIVAAIWGSAVLAALESYDKLVSTRGTSHLSVGMVAAVIGIVGNQLVARYKLRVGREIRSAPLIVDARHSWLDAVASGGALTGLVGVGLGFPQADPLAGFAIAALIVHIGVEATREVVSRLMDTQDDEVVADVLDAVSRVQGVQAPTEARARWLGRQVEVRLVLQLASDIPLWRAHDLAHAVDEAVRAHVPDVGEVIVIVNPPPACSGTKGIAAGAS